MTFVDYLARLEEPVALVLFGATFLAGCLLLAVARRLSRS